MNKLSRRGFIKTTGLAATGALVGTGVASAKSIVRPEIVTPEAMKASGKVNMAFIGIANQGASDFGSFFKTGLVNPVAVCDVDLDSKGAQNSIQNYAPKAKQFRDWREMFDKMGGDIDCVQAAIPDFAHFPVAVTCLQLGKGVYVEKPLSHTFLEAEILKTLAERNPKVPTQMGNQGHSGEQYYQFKAWKDAGIIKDITKFVAFMNGSRRWHPYDPSITKFPEKQPLPAGMTDKDWDTWLSQAAYKDFNEKYHPGNWRGWWDFGCGALGDWGFHICDTVHQFMELGLPYEVDPIHIVNPNDFFYPLEETLVFKFAGNAWRDGFNIVWYDGVDNKPELPEGYFSVSDQVDANIPFSGGAAQGMGNGAAPVNPQGGTVPNRPQGAAPQGPRVPQSGKIIYTKDLMFKGGTHSSPLSIIPEEKAKQMAAKLPIVPPVTSDHYENFVRAVMGEEKTRSPFQLVAPLSQTFSLGIIAARLQKKLVFDPETKEITNDKFANALLAWAPPRKGWESYYQI